MNHVTVIAEAGVNHNGNLDTARRLIDAAARAGADYVKFQTFNAASLVTAGADTAEYQKRNLHDNAISQYDMLKRLELSAEAHLELIDYCRGVGIKFLSTAFDAASVDLLASLHPDLWKIPSGEITNYPYLRQIARKGGRIVMSTGMCTPDDIDRALDVLLGNGACRDGITLLHCNTQYPTPMADVNLRSMTGMARRWGLPVGYSDHTVGIEVPVAAVALGATVIEKHITLDRNMPGPDQKASIEPDDLCLMVRAIRNIEQALGDGHKRVTDSERANITVARKSIVAAAPIKQGETLTELNLTTKRPGTGLSPMLWPQVVGTRAIRDFDTDQQIEI